MHRAWWKRMWVLQAVALGDSVILLCGSRLMWLEQFMQVCIAIFQSVFQIIDVVEDEHMDPMFQML
jgi:hypothetical protein